MSDNYVDKSNSGSDNHADTGGCGLHSLFAG